MSKLLSQSEIRALYGVEKGDVVAFGARIKHAVPSNKRTKRQITAEELYGYKPARPEVNLASEVVELI
jgi:hypothetical protein